MNVIIGCQRILALRNKLLLNGTHLWRTQNEKAKENKTAESVGCGG